MVSFKSNKEVKLGKRTFSFVAASGFLSLILYLVFQKCETDVIKNICNMVCIERYRLLFSNYSFSKAIILDNEYKEDIIIKPTSFIASVVEIDVIPPSKCQQVTMKTKEF